MPSTHRVIRKLPARDRVYMPGEDIDPQLGCTEHYGSSVCPIPGKNRLQAIHAAGRNDIDLEIKRLWAVADLDDSMFVTDEEGQRFRMLVDFGLMLDFLAKRTRSVAKACATDET